VKRAMRVAAILFLAAAVTVHALYTDEQVRLMIEEKGTHPERSASDILNSVSEPRSSTDDAYRMARALGELFAPSCKKPGLKEEAWAKCPVAVLGEGTEEDATVATQAGEQYWSADAYLTAVIANDPGNHGAWAISNFGGDPLAWIQNLVDSKTRTDRLSTMPSDSYGACVHATIRTTFNSADANRCIFLLASKWTCNLANTNSYAVKKSMLGAVEMTGSNPDWHCWYMVSGDDNVRASIKANLALISNPDSDSMVQQAFGSL